MEKTKYNKWLIVIILGLIAALVYTNLSSRHSRNISPSQITKTIIKSDTTIIVDTLHFPQPYPVKVEIKDTIYISIDSVKTEGDSILLLPIETKTYTDDSTYRAVVSGFHPKLEEITIFPKTYTIEKTKTVTVTKKDRWSYGIGLGFGYGMFNKKFDIYAGFTVGYTF